METFSLEVSGASIDSCWTERKVALCFNAEKREVCELLTVDDVICNFDKDELLDAIGADRAKEYFGLVEEDA